MLILQGVWSLGGGLRLWAEDAELPAVAAPRRGRRPKVPRPRDHPFACAPERLREVVEGRGEAAAVTLVLPTGGSGPLASPDLVREPVPDGRAQMADGLAPWRVPAVALPPAGALDLLLRLAGLEAGFEAGLQEEPGRRLVRAGDSLRFLAEVAGLALALVAAGRTLPGLVVEEGGLAARWRPVPRPDDTARLRLLARAMPPVCRAEQVGDSLEGRQAGEVLGEVLDGLVDAAARSALAGRRLLPARRGRRPGAVPAAEAWLAALTAADARVDAEPGDAAKLARTLEEWRRSALSPAGSLRTCFRLHQPPEDPEEEAGDATGAAGERPPPRAEPKRWRLEFLLQAADDPSLLVSASQVWKGGRALAALRRRAPHLQDELLVGLGRASRLYPELERALRRARPVQQELDSHGAHRFLGEVAPALDQAGFGVLLPSWWQAPGGRLGLRLKAGGGATDRAAVASGQLGLEALCDYRWEVALGDQTVSAEELAELAELKAPLVRLRGQWVELDQRRLRAALDFLERSGSGRMRAGEVLRTALDPEAAVDGDAGLPVVGVAAHGWLGDLLSGRSERRIQEVPTPAGFHGTLRPYQQRGLSWLKFLDSLGLGACLADDMGLGKCLSDESPIFLNGTLVTAEDAWSRFAGSGISDGEGEWARPTAPLTVNALAQHDGSGRIVPAAVTRLYRQRVSERLRRVRLDDGSEVLITRRHRLLRHDGWTTDMKPGDCVCVPSRLVWEGEPVDPDLTVLLAWQIAEGSEQSNGFVSIAQKQREALPDFIVSADLDTLRLFLRAYFSAVGSVNVRTGTVEISSASQWLMQQLACMLRRFGIWMRTSTEQKRATNGSGIFRPYHFGLFGGAALRSFKEQIGFSDPDEQEKLDLVCARDCNANVEGVPAPDLLVETRHRKAVQAIGRILSGDAERAYRGLPRSRWTASTPEAYRNLNPVALLTVQYALEAMIQREVHFARVVSVEDVDYNGWVYDFEVAEHHNFVAGGLLCHNTVQLLGLLAAERPEILEERPGPTLLVCPMSVVGNWQREAERFTPGLRVHVHHGSERLGGEALAEVAAGTDVVVTTYALVARDREALAAVEWGRVVLDEAQNVKNSAAAQTRAVRSLPARHRIALTGTPVENRLSELWSIMEFLNPGLLGPASGFRSRFAVPVERYGDEEAAARLKRVTGPFILRRLKTDRSVISDLPDKIEMKVYCNLTAEQASLYQAVVDDMLARIAESEGIERRGLVLATMLKLKQVCNHPAHLLGDGSALAGRSGKLARLEEVLEEVLAEGDKALCFTQFAELGHRLRAHLTERFGREVLFLHGGTPKRQRDEMVARFQDEHGPALFLLSLKAGGTGLNLTAASHVIHYDRWWNPAVEDQATDRAFRIGQRRDVQVRKLVCAGTVEERVDQMIETKKALAERIVGTGEQWLTELSVADLREVVELSADAVSE